MLVKTCVLSGGSGSSDAAVDFCSNVNVSVVETTNAEVGNGDGVLLADEEMSDIVMVSDIETKVLDEISMALEAGTSTNNELVREVTSMVVDKDFCSDVASCDGLDSIVVNVTEGCCLLADRIEEGEGLSVLDCIGEDDLSSLPLLDVDGVKVSPGADSVDAGVIADDDGDSPGIIIDGVLTSVDEGNSSD